MRDSLTEMVSQRANTVYVYRAVSLCYVAQTCVRINFMSLSQSMAEVASAALKKKKKKADRDVLVNEDMI